MSDRSSDNASSGSSPADDPAAHDPVARRSARRPTSASVPTIASRSARPATRLQDQLYERIKRAIVDGQLRFGERLPPVRNLSADFRMARGTVLAALHRLAGEGYVAASRSAGTRVVFRASVDAPDRASSQRSRATAVAGASTPGALAPGQPAFDAFPKKLWSRLVGAEARRIGVASMAYPSPDGEPELKRAIASYLRVSRGVVCEPDQVFVTNCFQGSQQFVRQLILREGDAVWVEDPGYRAVIRFLRASRIRAVPVPVDREGMCVEHGIDVAPDARAAFVAPTHQFPMGFALGDERRARLLDWADRASAWIVEDDYDGEFHYSDRALPALKSFDRHDRVVFCGTFSKVLFPALRIAYIVMPRALVEPATALARALCPAPTPLMQNVVATFIHDGHFSRHLARMRRLHETRRELLLSALTTRFSASQCIDNEPSGMHLLLRLEVSDRRVVDEARRLGLAPRPLSPMFVEAPAMQGLVVGFTDVTSMERADELVARLARAVDAATAAGRSDAR